MDKLIKAINQEIEKSNLKLAVIEGNKFNKGYTGAKYLHTGAIEAYEKVLSIIEGGFDNHDVLPSIISESDCDYRNKECTNEGETIDGKWVCSNHKRTAVDFLTEVMPYAEDSMPHEDYKKVDVWLKSTER